MKDDAKVEGNTIKIGLKAKHLIIPVGWQVVESGIVLKDDKFANVGNPNNPFWQYVESDDIGLDIEGFDCVIRNLETPQ